MIPTRPDVLDAEREEAQRQATASQSPPNGSLDGAGDVVEIAVDGGASLVVDIAGTCVDAAAGIASTSLDIIGGILGGLADL